MSEMTVEWMRALLTPTVAVVAVYVAWRQHRTAQEKLRLDLFERRFAVYVALRNFLGVVLAKATIGVEDLQTFRLKSAQSEFLFGRDVNDYLAEVRRRAIELRATNAQLAPDQLPIGRDRNEVADRNAAHLQWLVDQVDQGAAAGRFAPYLAFTDRQARRRWCRAAR